MPPKIGPVFVHADPCEGYAERNTYPPGFRERRQVVRAYDRTGRIADALAVEGTRAEAAIAQLLARPDVATLHSRNVLRSYMLRASSGLQGGGEGPRWEGRQGPSSALDRAVLLLDVLTSRRSAVRRRRSLGTSTTHFDLSGVWVGT